MSIIVTTDVNCDGCNDWAEGVVGPKQSARMARATVAGRGWRRVKRDGRMVDLCPYCVAGARP